MVIILNSGCIFNPDENTENTDEIIMHIYYELQINISNISNYEIIIPYPVNWTNFFSKLICNTNNTDTKYSIENITNDSGLKINSNKNLSLIIEDNITSPHYVKLSLSDFINFTSKIYCIKEPSNGSIFLNLLYIYSFNYNHEGNGYEIYSNINNNWQTITLRRWG